MRDSLKAADDGQVTIRYWVRGPLRLAVGLLQMVLAVAAASRVLVAGLSDDVAWLLVAAATAAMLASRWLYGAAAAAQGKAE